MHNLFNRVEKAKANYAETFTRKCMESPYIIGIEGNYGLLVNDNEEPIELVVQKTEELNNQMYEIHQKTK